MHFVDFSRNCFGSFLADWRRSWWDQSWEACLECHCDTFDRDRCMNSLRKRCLSICSRSMIKPTKSRTAKFYTTWLKIGDLGQQVILGFWYILTEQWSFYIILKFGSIKCSTMEPHYNEVLGTIKITLLYQVSHYIRAKKNKKYKELGPAKLPCYKRVLLDLTSL